MRTGSLAITPGRGWPRWSRSMTRDTLEAMRAVDASEDRARQYHRRQFALTLVDLALGVVLLAWWSWSGAAAAPGLVPRSAASFPRGGRRGHHARDRRLANPPDRSTRRRGGLRPPPPGRLAHPEPRELARRSREGARHRWPPRAGRGRGRLRSAPVEPGPVVALGERRPGGGGRAPGRRGPDLARPALLPGDAARGPGAPRPDPRPRRPHGGAARRRSSSRTSRARGASRTQPWSASGAPAASS